MIYVYLTPADPVAPTPPDRTFSRVRGHPPSEAHLPELPADRPGAHAGPGRALELGGERLHGGQPLLQRHPLQHLALRLLELVRTAAAGQSRRDAAPLPLEDDGAHGGAGQLQQGRDLPHGLLTQVAAHHGAPLEVTELLAAAHPLAAVRSLALPEETWVRPPLFFSACLNVTE